MVPPALPGGKDDHNSSLLPRANVGDRDHKSPVLGSTCHRPVNGKFLRAFAVIILLCCAGNVYGTQSHVPRPLRQFVYADDWKKFDKVGVTDRQNFCCVKDTLIAILASICNKNTNTELSHAIWLRVRNPMTVLFRSRDTAPTSANVAFGRDQGIPLTKNEIGGLPDIFFKPIVNVTNEALINSSDAVNDVTSGHPPDIHAGKFYEKGYFPFFYRIASANFANEFGINCQPRSKVAVSDFSGMSKHFRVLFDGSLRCLSADLGRFGGNAGIVKRRDYEDNTNSSDPPCCARPEGLILGSFSGAPFYAKLGLMLVLGGLAGVLINESGVRGFHNRNQGRLLLLLGLGCLVGSFIAALLFA